MNNPHDKSQIFILPQTTETSVIVQEDLQYKFRLAYSRSFDCQQSGDTGQDFVAIRSNEERIAFCLCDGVSQSFIGDLAARKLGEALLDWCWDVLLVFDNEKDISERLTPFLLDLSTKVTVEVDAYQISQPISDMMAEVFDMKRKRGSESTFVAGAYDFKNDRGTVVWMGDSRLRLWSNSGEVSLTNDRDGFFTNERWSSRANLVGNLHFFQLSHQKIQRIVAYSDGLKILDDSYSLSMSNQLVNNIIRQVALEPTSDDVSFIDIAFDKNKAWENDGASILVVDDPHQKISIADPVPLPLTPSTVETNSQYDHPVEKSQLLASSSGKVPIKRKVSHPGSSNAPVEKKTSQFRKFLPFAILIVFLCSAVSLAMAINKNDSLLQLLGVTNQIPTQVVPSLSTSREIKSTETPKSELTETSTPAITPPAAIVETLIPIPSSYPAPEDSLNPNPYLQKSENGQPEGR